MQRRNRIATAVHSARRILWPWASTRQILTAAWRPAQIARPASKRLSRMMQSNWNISNLAIYGRRTVLFSQVLRVRQWCRSPMASVPWQQMATAPQCSLYNTASLSQSCPFENASETLPPGIGQLRGYVKTLLFERSEERRVGKECA